MKLLALLTLVAFVNAHPSDDYSRYENFDIDAVINNIRLLTAHLKCYLGIGKCPPEGTDIKKWIPDALTSSCGKCSDKQKILVARVMKASMEKLPEYWKKLNELHNPDGKYDEQIAEFIKQYGN